MNKASTRPTQVAPPTYLVAQHEGCTCLLRRRSVRIEEGDIARDAAIHAGCTATLEPKRASTPTDTRSRVLFEQRVTPPRRMAKACRVEVSRSAR